MHKNLGEIAYIVGRETMKKSSDIACVVDPGKAPDVGIRVEAGPARTVMLAPEGEAVWGLFMFPSVWRLRDGRLVCAVTSRPCCVS